MPLSLAVIATLRSMTVQASLYAKGRTRAGPVFTDAEASFSYHNPGWRIGVVPALLLRLRWWADTPEHQSRTDTLSAKVGVIGKAVGFR